MTDSSGNVVERYTFSAYGLPLILTGAGTDTTWGTTDDVFATNPSASAIGNPYLYTGQRWDPETENHYYKNRYQRPTLGRFISRDPLEYVDGYSLYEYVGSRSLCCVDTFGLFPTPGQIGGIRDVRTQAMAWMNQQITEAGLTARLARLGGATSAERQFEKLSPLKKLGALKRAFDPGGDDDGTNLFVYTCKEGWIDLGHFMANAMASRALKEAGVPEFLAWPTVYAGSKLVESHQSLTKGFGQAKGWVAVNRGIHKGISALGMSDGEFSVAMFKGVGYEGWDSSGGWATSAYTLEDLPSNYRGAKFGAEYGGGDAIGDFENFLRNAGVVDPDRILPNGRTVRSYLKDDAVKIKGIAEGRINANGVQAYAYDHNPVKTPSHDCICDENGKPK
jgi:RHS repeat-associated protein